MPEAQNRHSENEVAGFKKEIFLLLRNDNIKLNNLKIHIYMSLLTFVCSVYKQ